MKKKFVLLIMLLFLLFGCNLNSNIKPSSLTECKGKYQMIYLCAYQKNQLLYCNYDKEMYFMNISDYYIDFIRPINGDFPAIETYNYNSNKTTINISKINSNNKITLNYKMINNLYMNGIEIEEKKLVVEDGSFLIFKSVYEKISKDDYNRKIGANNEK